MSNTANPQQRMTAEQRRRIEEEEEIREAARLTELARQREILQQWDEDRYVAHRMDREREAIAAEIQRSLDEALEESGGVEPQNVGRLMAIGAVLTTALLVLLHLLSRAR